MMIPQSSSRRARIAAAARTSTAARSRNGVSRHAGKARCSRSTVALAVCAVPSLAMFATVAREIAFANASRCAPSEKSRRLSVKNGRPSAMFGWLRPSACLSAA